MMMYEINILYVGIYFILFNSINLFYLFFLFKQTLRKKVIWNLKATLCDFYPHLAVKRYMIIQ